MSNHTALERRGTPSSSGRSPGRPSTGKKKGLHVKLREELYEWLHKEADKQNRSIVAIVTNALDQARLYK